MRDRLRVVVTIARDPALARIELAYLSFNLTEYATWVAIMVYAYLIGGAAGAGIAALVQLVPAGLAAPFAAVAGDRFRRDRVLVSGYVVQAAALLATTVALELHGPPTIVIALAAVLTTSLTFTRPVQMAILPGLTHRPEDLAAANSATGLAESLGLFGGPLVAGLVLTGGSPADVFAVFSVAAIVSAALVLGLPIDVAQVTPVHPLRASDIVRRSFDGFALLARQRQLLLLVAILASTFVVSGALDVVVVALAVDLLGVGQAWAGFLFAAFGLGGVIGALASVSLVGRRRLTPSLATSAVLYGGPISAIGIAAAAATAPLLLAASGAGWSQVTVAGRTLLQRVTPEDVLARVFGVLEGMSMLALGIGSIGAAALIETIGIPATLVVAGAFVPAIIVVAWLQLRAIDQDAPMPDPEALALLLRLPMFAPLPAPEIERILGGLTHVDLGPGEVIIREGEPGDRFYVLEAGRVEVTIEGRAVAVRGPGDHFGEIALLRSVPRTATVTAITAVRLVALERATFLTAVTGHPQTHASAEAVTVAQLAHAAPRPDQDP